MLVVALVIVAVVLAVVGMAIVGVVRGTPNQGVELGTNRPYPTGFLGGADEPPYMPSPVISEDEEFRRDAHDKLAARPRHPRTQHTSWMDEPGALERAGLVDAPATGTDEPPTPPAAEGRGRHHRTR